MVAHMYAGVVALLQHRHKVGAGWRVSIRITDIRQSVKYKGVDNFSSFLSFLLFQQAIVFKAR